MVLAAHHNGWAIFVSRMFLTVIMVVMIGKGSPAPRWIATGVYCPMEGPARSSGRYSRWYNVEGQQLKPQLLEWFPLQALVYSFGIPLISHWLFRWLSLVFPMCLTLKMSGYLLTFHVVSSQVPFRWSRESVRWQAESRSYPACCRKLLSDHYNQIYVPYISY